MLRYAPSAQLPGIRNPNGLTLGQVRAVAPSALTAEPMPGLSGRYSPISTRDIIGGLKTAGFLPVEIRQNRVVDANRRAFAHHVVRLQHRGGPLVDGVAQEILLTNSHDGTAAYRMVAGWFRFVCENGLVSGDIAADVRIAHRGDAVERAQEEATRMIERARESSKRIVAMKQRILGPTEQLELAERAIAIRWGEERPVHPHRLLLLRRYEDQGDNLWNVFNRIQENLIRGGVQGQATTGRRLTTRPVTSIAEDIRINRELFQAADELLETA